ncbi:MAG TPA: 4-hydroxy-tetrahydrodipicolinate synthase [Candidatus Latescibacteria bacterium]|nr:4-hydroxy-tetrahydrodipicolinate synthase [Candidatus Latescibacterota bacterium]
MLKLEGSFVALVTPFKDGRVNREKLKELVEFHLANGTDGIVPCGTTGESATLSLEEHKEVVEVVVEAVDGRVPVLAGAGSNNTKEAEELITHACRCGADGVLIITPYYNKPTQEGLFRHFALLNQVSEVPIVMYNVPGRTAVNMSPDTVARLSKLDKIVGIKEASKDLTQVSEILTKCEPDFAVVSGDDAVTLPMLAIGGKGVISVVANIAPQETADMVRHYLRGEIKEALVLHRRLFPLSQAMFLETNPAPVKAALNLLGKDVGEVRLPLVDISGPNRLKLRQVMIEFGFEVSE